MDLVPRLLSPNPCFRAQILDLPACERRSGRSSLCLQPERNEVWDEWKSMRVNSALSLTYAKRT